MAASAPPAKRTDPRRSMRPRLTRLALVLGVTAAMLAVGPSAVAQADDVQHTAYHQTNLVSDIPGRAAITDPNLVNPWGLAAGPTTPIWSNDNRPGLSTPNVPLDGNAQLKATVAGAVYKGLANLTTESGTFLYAANFSAGRIDVFNSNWDQVPSSGFRDRHLPSGYAPFNIQALGGKLYVAYAKQDHERVDEVAGPGRGFVDVFDSSGRLLNRLIRRDQLNAPWGLVIAPDGFGEFSGDLLVGNFGDGRIHAFDARSGDFRGELRDQQGRGIVIDGLWALRFGNGVFGDPTDLVFSAGIDDEAHGLLGTIEAVS